MFIVLIAQLRAEFSGERGSRKYNEHVAIVNNFKK